MLILTRKVNERVVVTFPDGRRMDVSIVEIDGRGKVRIGFQAPNDIVIHREEVHEAIEASKRSKNSGGAKGNAAATTDDPESDEEESTPLEATPLES